MNLTAASEIAMERANRLLEIPRITDPMGRSWCQPSPDAIAIDDTHALMTRATFEALAEYSATKPSGVYPGKMWRRHDGAFDPRCGPQDCVWLLCWYGYSSKGEGYCSNNYRIILLSDASEPTQ
jgi:hypothetical protein